jgi:hypothetical protein
MPDYGSYFERIIQALQQRPAGPPTWLIALLSSVVGGLFAVSAQLLRAVYDERRKRKLLVTMMHQELRKHFLTVYQFCPPESAAIDPRFIEFSNDALSVFGQEVLRKSPEIYLTTPEHWIAEALYFAFRRIGASKPEDLRNNINNVLFLYAFNLMKQEPFCGSARNAMTKEELDEVIPKAEAVLSRIPIAPFMFAAVARQDPQ